MIHHLQTWEQGSPVAYYFFDFGSHAKRTALGCISSIALQLCEQSSTLHKSAISLYEQYPGGCYDVTALSKAIGCMLRDSTKSFIIIDALDECLQEDDERGQVLSCLEHIHATAHTSRCLVSSRVEPDIRSALDDLGATNVQMLSVDIDKDIKAYVQSRLVKDKGLSKWNQRVKDEIEVKVLLKSKGM